MREDWRFKKLKEIGDIQTGTTPSTKNNDFYGNHIPFIKPAHFFPDGSIQYDGIGLSKKGIEKGRLIEKNSVLMVCIGASIGKTGYTTIPVSCNQQINTFTPKDGFDTKFYYYYMSSDNFFNKVLKKSSQATLPIINKTKWGTLEVPCPPLPEQKRIVAILDEAFEAIDQAKANVERNIENAEELFQSKLNEIFSQSGEGWEETTLGEMCSVLNGYAFKSKETIDSSNTQLLRMGNLYQNELDLERRPVFYPDSYAEEYEKYVLSEGDLIMSLTGTVDKRDYGYTVELPETDVTLLLNQRIMKIIIDKPDLINKSFLKGYLLSPFFLDKLYETASGTRQANLSSRKIMKLPFYYPMNIESQKKLVDVIQSVKRCADGIVHNNLTRKDNIEELKKSILQKAFTGELTANETVAA